MAELMNIAFVNSTRKWGGVKTWCINTAAEFAKLGVRAVLFGKDSRFTERARNKGIEARLVRFGFDYNPLQIGKFLAFFVREGVNCVIVNVGKDLKSAGLAARMAGIPVIHRIGSPGDVRHTLENRALHQIIRPAIICCSEYTRLGLLQHLPYLEGFTTTTIHPGVDISSHALVPSGRRAFITTSQLNADKRHADVIEACKILADGGLDFSLTIVGEGRLSAELREQVERLGLSARVRFTGYTDNVAGELRKADFFILPSHSEPLGIALEEAMACGLIPIARNAGGVPEIWPGFLAGHLLPQKSRGQEFASLISRLVRLSDTEIVDLKHQVREHANATFSLESQSKKTLDFITSLVDKRKRA